MGFVCLLGDRQPKVRFWPQAKLFSGMSHYHKILDRQRLFEQPLPRLSLSNSPCCGSWEEQTLQGSGSTSCARRAVVALTACQDNCLAFPAAPLPWRSAAPARWSCPGTAAPPASQSPTAPLRRTCREDHSFRGLSHLYKVVFLTRCWVVGVHGYFLLTKNSSCVKNMCLWWQSHHLPQETADFKHTSSGEKRAQVRKTQLPLCNMHVTMFLKQSFQLLPDNYKGQQKWKKQFV